MVDFTNEEDLDEEERLRRSRIEDAQNELEAEAAGRRDWSAADLEAMGVGTEGIPMEGAPAATPDEIAAAKASYAEWAAQHPDPTSTAPDDAPSGNRQTQPPTATVPIAQATTPTPGPRAEVTREQPRDEGTGQPFTWLQHSRMGGYDGSSPSGGNVEQLSSRYASLPEPPAAKSPNTFGLIAASALDLFLNKGKNTGALLGQMVAGDNADYENYERQMKHAQALADLSYAGRRGQQQPYSRVDPRLADYRERSIALREQQFEATQEQREAKAKEAAALKTLDSPETQSVRDAAAATGADPEKLAGMTGEQILQWRPQLGQMAQQLRSDAAWQERFGKTQAAVRAKEGRGEARDLAKEGRAKDVRSEERRATAAADYSKQYETDLDIAGLVQDIESSPGGTAPGFFERFRGVIMARGIDPERIEAWQAKQLVLELWARKQTGAVIAQDEDAKFAVQVGIDPAASAEQVEAAYNVLSRVIERRLKRGAVSNRDAAREIMEASGLDADRWTGVAPEAEPALGVTGGDGPKVNKVVGAASKPGDGGSPIGTRNGKPVVSIDKEKTETGLRVTIHYQDGSSETLERE